MRLFFSILLLFFSFNLKAQHSASDQSKKQFNTYLDSLKALSFEVINNPSEPERYNANYKMVQTLISALKLPNSFNFNFDSLKTISVLSPPDRRFKIFTWHLMNQDGSYRYYGTVQMNNSSGKLQMFPLVDYSPTFSSAEDSITTNSNWYGAQYYKVIPVTYGVPTPYYVLLGWKGNNIKTTKKVIEVLHFKNGKAIFGMPVFDGDKERVGKKRIIFEYNRQVSSLLNYLPKEGTIVFDHLAAPDPKMVGKFEFYGPDMSYDGFKLSNGRWKLIEDLQLKNSPSAMDDDYNDPKKPAKKVTNKVKQME